MPFHSKTIRRLHTVPFKIPLGFYIALGKLILKLMQKSPRKSQDMLEGKEWVVEACFTIYQKFFYRAVVIKILVMAQEYPNSLAGTGQTLRNRPHVCDSLYTTDVVL